MKLFNTLLLLCCSVLLSAQLVYTEPAFPTVNDEVTIFFNAEEGTGGLADCGCDIYIHTGVITNASTSPTDWKHVQTTWGVANDAWKLDPVDGEDNLFTFTVTPSVQEYYNVGDNETVEQIAMVFRNADGSLEGKATGGADIFAPIYASTTELQTILTSPATGNLVVEPGESILVQASSTLDGNLTLTDNGMVVATATGTSLTHTIVAPNTSSTHEVIFTAEADGMTSSKSFSYVVATELTGTAPAGIEPGITYLSDTEVRFALVAPMKTTVFVKGDFTDWNLDTDYQMTRDGDLFWVDVAGLTPDTYHQFQYLVDGEILIADPFSELILDAGNDPFISEETFPNLPEYPIGETTGRVGLIRPGAPDFDWQHDDFEPAKKTDLVIYELLLRDFIDAHNYQTLLDTLDYLENLGINAIELMPVNEFSGNISWGYNPTYHAALDKYYGTPEAFKILIDEAHSRGIAIILDIVFNHAHEDNPYAEMYWNSADFRPADDSPYMNPTAPHNFSVFFDYNHESSYTREYFKQVLRYWIDEYHVDGFRFDLSKGLTQNENGPFDAGAYDGQRIAILKEYADQIWELDPDNYVIMEHFAANSEEEELSDYGMMLWGGFGPHDDYLEAAMGYQSNFTNSNYMARGWDDPHLIVYAESHDEERMMYKNLQFGNSSGDYDVQELPTALDRIALTHNFFLTIPGPKMLWQFQELGYQLSINTCPNGTVNNSCRTDPKPILWGYLNETDRAQLYLRTAALIKLRTEFDVFETTDYELNVGSYQKVIKLYDDEMDVVVLGNFDVEDASITPGFPGSGTWYEFWTGEELEVTDVNMSFDFAPGEYRLYTTQPLETPVAVWETLDPNLNFTLSPNPATDRVLVSYQTEEVAPVRITLFDVFGRELQSRDLPSTSYGTAQFELNELPRGAYLLKLSSGSKTAARKLIVE